jgi:hypothetical protein
MFREMTHASDVVLDNDQIQRQAPSVFATEPHHEVSNRYGFVSTIDIVDALRYEGWMPVDATQRNVRDISKRELTTHLLRFRRVDDPVIVGDSVVELLLKNAHDRSSAYVLHAGVFKFACANGIVVADSTFSKMSVRHGKNVVDDIIEGSYEIIEEVPVIAGHIEGMQSTMLSSDQRYGFARDAYELAFGKINRDNNLVNTESNLVGQMLLPRRKEDTGTDLWTTFNVLQENLIRGGISTIKYSDKAASGIRRNTSRAVKNIDKNIKLNKALWNMATELKRK